MYGQASGFVEGEGGFPALPTMLPGPFLRGFNYGPRRREGCGGVGTWCAGLEVYTPAFVSRSELDGDKVILPPSALESLMQQDATPPFLFSVRNVVNNITLHCSVLEFSSPERQAIIPFWMMSNLGAEEGVICAFKTVGLPKGTFVRFKPTTADFYTLTNHKALLESLLSKFTVLCKNTTIEVKDPASGKRIGLTVLDLEPAEAVCILETDIRVDFAPADGMPQEKSDDGMPAPGDGTLVFGSGESEAPIPQQVKEKDKFVAFQGQGHDMKQSSPSADLMQCTNCGGHVPKESFELHSLRCVRIIKRCERCGKGVRREDFEKHVLEEHTPVACHLCGEMVDKLEAEKHDKELCPCRKVDCSFCGVSLPLRDMPKHEDYCGKRTELCPDCKRFVQKQHMLQHLSTRCQFTGDSSKRNLSASVICCPRCFAPYQDMALLEHHLMSCKGVPSQDAAFSVQRPVYPPIGSEAPVKRKPVVEQPTEEFECPLCQHKFGTSTALELHINEHHGAILDETSFVEDAGRVEGGSPLAAEMDPLEQAVDAALGEVPDSRCPICDTHVPGGVAALTDHVNAHLAADE